MSPFPSLPHFLKFPKTFAELHPHTYNAVFSVGAEDASMRVLLIGLPNSVPLPDFIHLGMVSKKFLSKLEMSQMFRKFCPRNECFPLSKIRFIIALNVCWAQHNFI